MCCFRRVRNDVGLDIRHPVNADLFNGIRRGHVKRKKMTAALQRRGRPLSWTAVLGGEHLAASWGDRRALTTAVIWGVILHSWLVRPRFQLTWASIVVCLLRVPSVGLRPFLLVRADACV